ncbi:MAG: transcription termination/antitermination factor NusG [Planctomycetes bacterium]|nr:transcription termination/antitermination factor NusG [Planctomycetota bacterium]
MDQPTEQKEEGKQPEVESALRPEDQAVEQPEEQSDVPSEEQADVPVDMRWYVLRVATNREEGVRDAMVRKIEIEHLTEEIGRIVVPTERIKRVRGSQQRVYERKLYPGYVFVEMALTEEGNIPEQSWFAIKETSGVGDFIGTEGKPTAMSSAEVSKMLHQVEDAEESPTIQLEFKKEDQIKVKGGAFEGYEGYVEDIDTEKGTVCVIVTIFGRATPLDIEYWQLEKV